MRKYVIRVSGPETDTNEEDAWSRGIVYLRSENKDADQLRSSEKSPPLNYYNYFMLKHPVLDCK